MRDSTKAYIGVAICFGLAALNVFWGLAVDPEAWALCFESATVCGVFGIWTLYGALVLRGYEKREERWR